MKKPFVAAFAAVALATAAVAGGVAQAGTEASSVASLVPTRDALSTLQAAKVPGICSRLLLLCDLGNQGACDTFDRLCLGGD